MKAVTLSAYGDADELELRDLPEPSVGLDDVKVRMFGASINPIDWKLRSGALQAMMPLAFPFVLGRDASGVVVEVGPRVAEIEVGMRVMGLVTGGYAEFVVAPADAWVEVPDTLDLVDAAALPLVLLTGAQLIEDAVRLRRGDVVLVTGALGSVGRAAVYVARSRGAQVWAGVRSTQELLAATLDVAGVVALDSDTEIAKLPLFDCIADTIGGPTLAKLFGRMKPGGTIGSVVGQPPGASELGLTVRGLLAHSDRATLASLARAVADGTLVIPIVDRLPLSRAREAQELAQRHAGGKVILMGMDPVREAVRPRELQAHSAHQR